MNLVPKHGVRRVSYSGHQSYWEGYFHAWTKDGSGNLMAVIEMPNGKIHLEASVDSLTFHDGLE